MSDELELLLLLLSELLEEELEEPAAGATSATSRSALASEAAAAFAVACLARGFVFAALRALALGPLPAACAPEVQATTRTTHHIMCVAQRTTHKTQEEDIRF